MEMIKGIQLMLSSAPLINGVGLVSSLSPTGFRASLVACEVSFSELASQESDCSSAKKGGDLGPFGRGQMQSEFFCPYR